jgi:hypothetical protein
MAPGKAADLQHVNPKPEGAGTSANESLAVMFHIPTITSASLFAGLDPLEKHSSM